MIKKPPISTPNLCQLIRDLWLVRFNEATCVRIYIPNRYTISSRQARIARIQYRQLEKLLEQSDVS